MVNVPPQTRLMEAFDGYMDALGKDLNDADRRAFLDSAPTDPNEVAKISYYMEQMTPELERLNFVMKGQALQADTAFDTQKWEAVTDVLPRDISDFNALGDDALTIVNLGAGGYHNQLVEYDFDGIRQSLEQAVPTPGVIALYAYTLEQETDPEILKALSAQQVQESIRAYNEDFEKMNTAPNEMAAPLSDEYASTYDVVNDGGIAAVNLSEMFVASNAHNGDQSLETIRNESQNFIPDADIASSPVIKLS
jgi:hypothetical protein